MQRIVIIGFGAIGRLLYDRLMMDGDLLRVVGLVVRPDRVAEVRAAVDADVAVCASVSDTLSAQPTLFVECAGHAALREHAAPALKAGIDLLVASVGALADADLEAQLVATACGSGAHILLPSGALGGLDALAAARESGLDEVEYRSVKAVSAWRGSYAEQLVDLDGIDRPTVFFTGDAREAARRFPQNANVAAAVAFAGNGFERTKVALTADPEATGNRHHIRARGTFGIIEVTVEGRTLPENPKTSILAPMSLLRAIHGLEAPLKVV